MGNSKEATILNNSRMSMCINILIMVLIAIHSYFKLTGIVSMALLVIIAIAYIFLPLQNKVAVLFFITSFTANITTKFVGVPFISILQLIFLVAFFIKKGFVINYRLLITGMLLIGLQFVSIAICNQSFVSIFVFLINIILCYAISDIAKSGYKGLMKLWLTNFIIGVTLSLTIGLLQSNLDDWRRYRGLWTDPNFLAMFCLLGIAALIILSNLRISRLVASIPIIVLCAYSGYLTESRTFLICFVAMMVFVIGMLLPDKSISIPIKIVIGILLVIGMILFYKYIWTAIVESRGIISTDGRDWTNGRIDDIQKVLLFWSGNILYILFGIGVDNSLTNVGIVTHNTYFDLFIEFGIIGSILFILLLKNLYASSFKGKRIYPNIRWLPIFILLVYAGTLSMLTTDALYLFLSLMPLFLEEKEKKERLHNRLFKVHERSSKDAV